MMTDAEKLAFRAVVAELGERGADTLDQIWLLTTAYGFAFVCRHVERAKEVQAAGGMRRADNGQPRTLGGIFFQVVKSELGPEQFRAVTLSHWRRAKLRRKRWLARKAAQAQAEAAAAGSMASVEKTG